MSKKLPICPACGKPVPGRTTRYGRRHECCGLRSWDGKPLVSDQVHKARTACHEVFDPLWQRAPDIYEIAETGVDRVKAERRIRRSARNRAYLYMAYQLGRPEPEVHMTVMADLDLMRRFYRLAKAATPQIIRNWWKVQRAQGQEITQ